MTWWEAIRTTVGLVIYSLALLTLAGCASLAAPEVVKVPVPVPCEVPVIESPSWATESLNPDAQIDAHVRALWAEILQHQAYEGQLNAVIDACRK